MIRASLEVLAAAVSPRAGRRAALAAAALAACLGVIPPAVPVAQTAGRVWYVAPNGGAAAAGSISAPLSLAAALSAASPVGPGDTVWLRGGTYNGTFTSYLVGTAAAPIVVRQFPGERAVIDSAPSAEPALYVTGAHTWFRDFEIRSSDPTRNYSEPYPASLRRGAGVTAHAPGAKFINLVIHDLREGIEMWSSAPDAEAYGNLIYHIGYGAPDRGHGHGIYAQNRTGEMRFTDNVLFSGFSHGIHAYGSSNAALNNFRLEGNIIFNSGLLSPYFVRNILVGGGSVAQNPTVIDNLTYFGHQRRGGDNNLGYAAGCTNLRATGNYFGHPAQYPIVMPASCGPTLQNNDLIGFVDPSFIARFPANRYVAPPPAGVRTFVRPNRYEPGRAHIAVFNWDQLATVDVNVAAAGLTAGDGFEVRDLQNVFGPPVLTGTYSGAPLRLPMDATGYAAPVGAVPLPATHTNRQFGAFLLRKSTTPAQPAPPAPRPDLAVTVTAAAAAAAAGQPASYTFRVANVGSAAASNVVLATASSSAVTWGALTTTRGSCTSGWCAIGSLAAGATADVMVTVTPSAGPTIEVSATVSAAEAESATANNTATATAIVTTPAPSGQSDLAVLLAGPSTAATGTAIPIALSVRNLGSGASGAATVTLTVRAPAWVVGSLRSDSAACRARDGAALICTVPSLSAGTAVALPIVVAAGTVAGPITIAASLGEGDGAAGNDTASLVVTTAKAGVVAPPPPPPTSGSHVDLIVSGTTAHVGGTVVATFTVRNAGAVAESRPHLATLVRAAPWVIASISVRPPLGASCTGTTRVACELGPLPAGASTTVELVMTPRLDGTVAVDAEVSGSSADANTTDNRVTVSAATRP